MLNTNPWLEAAIAHGSTKWVKQFIQTYLPQIKEQSLSSEEFAQVFDEQLQTKGLTTPKQQKNYRSNVVQAIKSIDEHHPAIALIALTSDQYRDLNDEQRGKLANRETQYFTSEVAQQLVDRATNLLDRAEWSDVGAGLAVLIGRRISEILLSDFSLHSSWSLKFSAMSKKADADDVSIEIPTLAPAELVLNAIQKLQASLKIDDLKLSRLNPKMAKQSVNSRFSNPIAAKCDQHYGDLIPTRSDRENLYTHVFRAVYATIAAHWFCPVTRPDYQFKAEIQGHFTLDKEGRKLPNFSARTNYDDYAIGTPDGNRDGRLGIRLGQLPGLQVLEVFRRSTSVQEPAMHPTQPDVVPLTQLEVSTMNAFAARATKLLLDPDPNRIAIALIALTGQLPLTLHSSTWSESSKFSIFNRHAEIHTLTTAEQVISGIRKLNASAIQNTESWLEVARSTFSGLVDIAEIADLQALYTQVALFRFCPADIDDETFIRATQGITSAKFTAIADRGNWLDQRNVLPLRVFQSPIPESLPVMPTSSPPQAKPKVKAIKVDLALLHTVCDLFDIPTGDEYSDEQAIQELLNWIKAIDLKPDEPSEIAEPESVTLAAAASQIEQTTEAEIDYPRALFDQSRAIGLLSNQIDTLTQQVQQLKAENSQLSKHQSDSEQMQQLKAENQHLRQELKQTQSRLDQIHQLLGGTLTPATPSSISTPSIALVKSQPPIPDAETTAKPIPTAQPTTSVPTPVTTAQPISTTTATDQPKRDRAADTKAKINQIIDSILKWNQQQPSNDSRIFIAVNPIKAIGAALKATYQPVILQVMDERKAEIDQAHQKWMLGNRHNRNVKNINQVLKAIAKEILNLDNWEQVKDFP